MTDLGLALPLNPESVHADKETGAATATILTLQFFTHYPKQIIPFGDIILINKLGVNKSDCLAVFIHWLRIVRPEIACPCSVPSTNW